MGLLDFQDEDRESTFESPVFDDSSEQRPGIMGLGNTPERAQRPSRIQQGKNVIGEMRRRREQAQKIADRARKIRKRVALAKKVRYTRIMIALLGGGGEVFLIIIAIFVILGGVFALYEGVKEAAGNITNAGVELVMNPGETLSRWGNNAYSAVKGSATYCLENDCSGLSGQQTPNPWAF